ncbi:MAG: monofunctional biosynthetic peptidoglycan transglycosylase [Rhizobiales bacterium]|nr:monofunctional biosynthetic peptidoglycan transglycosylase [Hyphomicrobiales bacterium]
MLRRRRSRRRQRTFSVLLPSRKSRISSRSDAASIRRSAFRGRWRPTSRRGRIPSLRRSPGGRPRRGPCILTQFLSGTAIDRRWVPLKSISRNLVRAVIVSEDGRFCEHSGIDTAAIKEAIERASRGTPRGASTISMQVTKNLFLWNAKSYVRKVIEIPLTLYMELLWPKARILEVYLNIAEWGPGVFGAEAAAQRHFGKSAARLGEREAALLAAVLPNPVVRDAGSPSAQTSAKARVVQARVKAYGSVASCVASAAAATTPAAQTPAVRPPRTIRKTPSKPAARKKQPAPANDWAPVLNFGSP